MEHSNNLSLPYIMPSQAQKHVTHNEAVRMLDTLVQMHLLDVDVNEPPSDPHEGAAFGIGPNPVAEWDGRAGSVAAWHDGAWQFHTPGEGWYATVGNPPVMKVFQSGIWQSIGTGQLETLGLNSEASLTRRLAVASQEVLFEGQQGNFRLYLKRQSSSDIASIIFQNHDEGLAELGLEENGAFSIRLFDGTNWKSVLSQLPDGSIKLDSLTSINEKGLDGRVNSIVNGSFSQWQRGDETNVAVGSQSFVADCWSLENAGAAEITGKRSTELPDGFVSGNSVLIQPTVPGATSSIRFGQRLETGLERLSAKHATLSFWIKGEAGLTLISRVQGHSQSTVLDGTWQKIVQTVVLGNLASENVHGDGSLQVDITLSGFSQDLLVSAMQLESGSVASRFSQRSPGDEARSTRRYLQVFGKGSWNVVAAGVCDTPDRCVFPLPFATPFSGAPSQSIEGAFVVSGSGWHPASTASAITFGVTSDNASIIFQKAGAFTSGQSALLMNEGDPDGRIVFSSELQLV